MIDQKTLVTNELNKMGFVARNLKDSFNFITVSLKNRKISTSEIETALEQVFGEIQFTLKSRPYGVLISW